MHKTLLTIAMALFLAGLATLHYDADIEGNRAPGLAIAQKQQHEEAMRAFRQQRYAMAYARFARLADTGHAPSAHIALVMFRNGPLLFGSHCAATVEQQQRWNALIVNGARDQVQASNHHDGH